MSLRRPLAAVVAVVAAAGLLSGCGVAGTDFRPGVATSVEGESISTRQVDEVADGMCSVLQSDSGLDGQTFAGSVIRNAAYRGLALRLIGEELLAAYDVSLPPEVDDGEQAVRDNYAAADPEDLDAAMPAFTGDSYLFNVLVALGRDEVGAEATDEEAVPAGIERAQAWQDQADIEVNPAFDSLEIGDEQVLTSRDDLSVAVSDTATQALAAATEQGAADDLPASQRCSA